MKGANGDFISLFKSGQGYERTVSSHPLCVCCLQLYSISGTMRPIEAGMAMV